MVTLAELLAQPRLRLGAIHLPHPECEVRWVATSELAEPGPFLEGSELLLTTGLDTSGWRSEWDRYIARIADVPIAALGIGTGLTHARPPRSLVKACERHGVNLIEVPRRTTFVAVSRRTAELLEQQEAEENRVAFDLQRRLTASATRPKASESIVETLAGLLSGGACVVAVDGEVLQGPFGPGGDSMRLDQIGAEIIRIKPRGLRAAAAVMDAEDASIAIHPVGLGGRPASYLAVALPGRPNDGQRSAITTAISLLGLVAEQERGRAESLRLIHDKALQLVIAGEVSSARLVLDVTPARARLASKVRILRAAGTAENLGEALGWLTDQGVVAGGQGELCAAAPANRADGLAEQLAARNLLVGIGSGVDLADARTSHHTAGLALAQATPAGPVVAWERIVANGPLTLIAPDQAQAFAASLLGGLDPRQVATLSCFLRHHGSLIKVADELGIHRNTVRNRLASIEAELGGSLDDPQVRVSAWIALQAR